MITQPIRAQSLKFVTTLCVNEPSRIVRKPSQTLCKAEETFLQSTVSINCFISVDCYKAICLGRKLIYIIDVWRLQVLESWSHFNEK